MGQYFCIGFFYVSVNIPSFLIPYCSCCILSTPAWEATRHFLKSLKQSREIVDCKGPFLCALPERELACIAVCSLDVLRNGKLNAACFLKNNLLKAVTDPLIALLKGMKKVVVVVFLIQYCLFQVCHYLSSHQSCSDVLWNYHWSFVLNQPFEMLCYVKNRYIVSCDMPTVQKVSCRLYHWWYAPPPHIHLILLKHRDDHHNKPLQGESSVYLYSKRAPCYTLQALCKGCARIRSYGTWGARD